MSYSKRLLDELNREEPSEPEREEEIDVNDNE